MAGHGNTNSDGHPAQDIKAHHASYERFIGWFKWGAVISFVVAAVVVVIIAQPS